MIKTNRKGLKKGIDKIELNPNDSVSFSKENIMFIRWRDKRYINMITTLKCNEVGLVDFFNKETLSGLVKAKPLVVFDYSYSMKGVDTNNQLQINFCYSNNIHRW